MTASIPITEPINPATTYLLIAWDDGETEAELWRVVRYDTRVEAWGPVLWAIGVMAEKALVTVLGPDYPDPDEGTYFGPGIGTGHELTTGEAHRFNESLCAGLTPI